MAEERTSTSRARLWHIIFWPFFLISIVVAVTCIHQVTVTLSPDSVAWRPRTKMNLLPVLGSLRANSAIARRDNVLFLGDSTVASYEKGFKLPDLTRSSLKARQKEGRPLQLTSLAAPGTGIDFPFLFGDQIIASRPDLVIWQLSFAHFTKRWTNGFTIPELAGWVAPTRALSLASQPPERLGLTSSDILFYQAIVRSGQAEKWSWLRDGQIRVGKLREHIEEALNPNSGTRPEKRSQAASGRRFLIEMLRRNQPLSRYSEAGEIFHFGQTLDGLEADHPMVEHVGETVELFTSNGVDVLVFLNPLNLDNLRDLGMDSGKGIAQTAETVSTAVRDAGGEILDLHALLGNDAFVDSPGHYSIENDYEATRQIAERISKRAALLLRQRARAGN